MNSIVFVEFTSWNGTVHFFPLIGSSRLFVYIYVYKNIKLAISIASKNWGQYPYKGGTEEIMYDTSTIFIMTHRKKLRKFGSYILRIMIS